MKNQFDLAKYKRMTQIVYVIVKITAIIASIATGIAMVLSLLLLFMPVSALSMFPKALISMDNIIMFNINTLDASSEGYRSILLSLSVMIATLSVIFASIFRQLTHILRSVKDGKPFAAENSNRLNRIGITLIVGSIVSRIAEYAVAYTIIHSLKMPALGVNFSADSNMIVMGFIVLILSGVFKYGSYLQREYDSTV